MAKVMVSLPDDLLARVDREVRRRGTSRSALLQEGAHRVLGRPDPTAARDALARIRAAFEGKRFEAPAEDLIRRDRDELDARDRSRL